MKDLLIRHKLFLGTIIILILLVIPLTILQVQTQQELRQRAAPVAKADIGIRLCASGPVVDNLLACNSKVQGTGDWAVKIVAVNNSDEPVDISAFDLQLSYYSSYIKSIVFNERNDYTYNIILNKNTVSTNNLGSDSRMRIVGVNNTSSPRIIAPNEVIMLAAINVEPVESINETGLDIANATKITVNGVKINTHKHIAPQANSTHDFTMSLTQSVSQVTGVPTTAPGAPTNTPTPIPGAPTNTPTPIPGAPTATPTLAPTATPTLAPTPAPGDTVIQFQGLSLNSIFTDKDGELISRKPQKLTVYLYKSTSDLKGKPDHEIKVQLDFDNGVFSVPSINFEKVTPGTYKILIKSSKYLRRLVATQAVSASGGTITIPSNITLADRVGDIIQDNVLNIQDYEAIRSCFGEKRNTSSCQTQYKENVDLNDDDKVDGIDFNLFLKSLSLTTREGD